VTGRVTIDLGIGRRRVALGPLEIRLSSPREVVFDVIAKPYLEATPRAMAAKLRVLDRGADLVLAEHRTALRPGPTALTVETVRFRRPDRVDFRLARGPVPSVMETFDLVEDGERTLLRYSGELETDLWSLGTLWGRTVARRWTATVEESLGSIKAEAERRASVVRSPKAGRPGP